MKLMHGSVKKWHAAHSLRAPIQRDLYGRELKDVFSDDPQSGHISLDGL